MTTNQSTPGPWRTLEDRIVPARDYEFTVCSFPITEGDDNTPLLNGEDEANRQFIVAACNACMAVSPDSPITVAECIPELVKLARLVTTRPEWQQAVDDLGLSNQIHKLLTCIERRHK